MGDFYRDGTCEVCSRKRPVGVLASAWGPVSQANCQECLQKPAEPLSTFEYLYETLGPDKVDPRIRYWYTWIDGRYVHWDNFVLRKKSENAGSQ